MFELEILNGARAGAAFPVRGSFEIGRDPACELCLTDTQSSRRHAWVEFDGTRLWVNDASSSNGTFVNGTRIDRVELKAGDEVELGTTRLGVRWRNPALESIGPVFGFEDEPVAFDADVMVPVAAAPRAPGDADALAARLQAVFQVSNALADIQDLEGVFQGVLESLLEVFPQADRGFLMLGNDPLALKARAVLQRDPAVGGELKVSTSICRRALESRSAVLFNHMDKPGFELGKSVQALDIRSAMAIPLVAGEQVEGLLQIDTPDARNPFTGEDLELAVAVAHQVAIALHNALLLRQVERETTTRNNLIRFLPGPLVDQAVKGEIDLSLGGRSCAGTILFSDVVGFTRMSEALSPEDVVALMNRYFDRMVPCIGRTGGAIDKYLGDAIMAFWGIPFEEPGAAIAGATSGLAMQTALVGFNSLQAADGQPALGMGIGINSGPVVAGNIGSRDRTEYTVLGDTVNTAQRIESTAGRTQTLLHATTWDQLDGRGHGLRMPPRTVKNKVDPLDLYSLRGLRTDDDEVVLHLPVRWGPHAALLIRRLADGSFVLLHPVTADGAGAPLTSDAPEWPGVTLGAARIVARHDSQPADGVLVRSQLQLEDETLAGLLGPQPIRCALAWEEMPRG